MTSRKKLASLVHFHRSRSRSGSGRFERSYMDPDKNIPDPQYWFNERTLLVREDRIGNKADYMQLPANPSPTEFANLKTSHSAPKLASQIPLAGITADKNVPFWILTVLNPLAMQRDLFNFLCYIM
jgi:hypothetical protein